MTIHSIDEAVSLAFQARDGKEIEPDVIDVRDMLLAEVERLRDLKTFEARFTLGILEPLADDLYRPNLGNAFIE